MEKTINMKLTPPELLNWSQMLNLPALYLSPELKIIKANEAALEFFPKESLSLYKKDFSELQATYGIDFPVISEKGRVVKGRTITSKKAFQWIVCTIKKNRRLAGYVVIIRDISVEEFEHRESEHTKSFFENLIALMPGNIYWLNREGVYLGCNDNAAKYLKLKSRDDIVGKVYEDLYDPQYVEALRHIDNEVMRTGELKVLEEGKVDEQQGKRVVYLTHKVPYRDERGEVMGMLGISLDISDRKKAEQELKKAKERAEAANLAKSQFIENMQHDLRTPTLGIYGLLRGWVKHEPKKADRKKFYQLMSKSSGALLAILDSVLQFTRIEAGDLPITDKKFHLRKLVDQVVALYKPVALHKKLKFSAKVYSDVPDIIIGDQTRTNRILVNLISNAVKFTQKGFVRIKVKMTSKPKKRHFLLKFVVEDSGIGIHKNQKERIYEKFVKVDPSNRCATYRGSGLGLTFVKQFVDELSGEVDLVSKVGKGSKFTVVLPFKLSIQKNPDEKDFED